jgi:hypothetical protein
VRRKAIFGGDFNNCGVDAAIHQPIFTKRDFIRATFFNLDFNPDWEGRSLASGTEAATQDGDMA